MLRAERIDALFIETDEVLARRRALTRAKRELANAQARHDDAAAEYERSLISVRTRLEAERPLFCTQAE